MNPYWSGEDVTVYHGNCVTVMAGIPEASIDAIVCDPPYELAFMSKRWDATGVAFDPATWRAALRVLKPGGHLLAFGGTRTWHRLACAVEDAGFEIRDSIAWLYGSGFPKSLNVSAAIDKRMDWQALPLLQGMIRNARSLLGISQSEAARRIGMIGPDETLGGGGFMWFETGMRTPTADQYARLKTALALDETCDEVFTAAEREVLETRTVQDIRNGHGRAIGGAMYGGEKTGTIDHHITAPATDAAKRWQGWGTALKPGHEPCLLAQKPFSINDFASRIGSHLERLEQEWQALEADHLTRIGAAVASPEATDTSWFESARIMFWNTVTSWRSCWAELSKQPNTSTIRTTAATTTTLKTLSSCISSLTPTNMLQPATSPPGLTSIASAVDNLFASVVCGLRATHALSVIEIATGTTRTAPPDAAEQANRPAFEPVVVARKPLTGTVAQCVTTWGTGALNIEGCRIGTGGQLKWDTPRDMGYHGGTDSDSAATANPAGRWPANVVLDPEMAEVLDRQSGVTAGKVGMRQDSSGTNAASRYFFVADDGPRFRYTAKAPTSERPSQGGIQHATVKPLSLMQYLVRLVTPPGGTVLDPFAGSGTTGEAAVREGFKTILIEQEADYLPLILERFRRPINYIMDFGDGEPA